MSRLLKILITLMIPAALVLAWAAGQQHTGEATIQQLSHISSDITDLTRVEDNLYRGNSRSNPNKFYYIAYASNPSYGGPLKVAAVVDSDKNILYTAILSSSDTDSYLKKVVGLGKLGTFIDQPIDQLSEVDAVSGATLTSTAIIRGVQASAQKIGSAQFGMSAVETEHKAATPEVLKILVIVLFFAAALVITETRIVKHKNKARSALLFCSVPILGFAFGSQYSLATVVSLINGSWLRGMATYAALLCLILTIGTFLVTRKNIFCTYICPFGAVQEGMGKITGCPAPVQQKWMAWVARSWVFVILLAALYYQAPAFAMYEPFGKMFNFIGSGIIYSLTILIVLSSLMFRRPWCHLFCPTTIVVSYLRFARSSFTSDPAGKNKKVVKEGNQ